MNDSIDALIEPKVRELGFDLEAVEIKGQGKHRVLRVAIDSDAGVGIDEIARVTRALGPVLDETNEMGNQPYTLEVTTRGVDRPLTLPRHWRRNHGRVVAVDLVDTERFEARIGASDDEGVDLEVKGEATRFPFSDIAKAVIQVELNRKDV
ncbi:MAG: ribosome maturation factor RimP [Aeromicrobium sp.]|nr:MAG: ribosome maturation factor RimP [Aeromicrobium sp.]